MRKEQHMKKIGGIHMRKEQHMKKIGGMGFLLCLVIGLLGCGKATGVSEADQYFGTYMTDDGLTSAMQGRFLSE